MRARSIYDTVGDWSRPELLAILRVPSPENVTVQISAVKRRIGGNQVVATVNVTVEWSQVFEIEDGNDPVNATLDGITSRRPGEDVIGYEVVVGLSPVLNNSVGMHISYPVNNVS